MSRMVRKLATSLRLFGSMYIFHFDLRMKSISSCGSKVGGLCSRKFTWRASIHSTARCRCGGHNWKWGRVSHSLGMCAADVRNILANLLCVQFHVRVPSPHSISRCSRVSLCPHSVRASVLDIRMCLCLTFVGMIS